MTNTFGGNRLRLALHGLSARVDELNRTAAILARAEVRAAGDTRARRRRHRPERRDRRAPRHARLRDRRRRLPRAGRVPRRRWRRPHLDRDDVRPQRDQGRHRRRAPGRSRHRPDRHDDLRHSRPHDDGRDARAGGRGARRRGAPTRSAATAATARTSSSPSSSGCAPPIPTPSWSPSRTPACRSSSTCGPSIKRRPGHDGRLRRPVARRRRHDRRRLLRQHARPPARDVGRAPPRPPRTDRGRIRTCRPARSRSASSSPKSSARSAGRRSSTWSGRSRTSATTRSGSASTSSTDGPIGRHAGRGRRGPRWPPSPPRRRGSSSGRSSRARTSTTRRCSPSRPSTIDEISGGRLILGLGAGWNETEFRAFGFPFDHRIDRFEEAFTIIRTLLRDGAIDFDGRFYQARDCELLPRGPRPAGPPLMIGSLRPADAAHHAAARRFVERVVRRHRQLPRWRAAVARPRRCGLPRRRSRPRRGRADGRRPGPTAGRPGPHPGRLREGRAIRRWKGSPDDVAEVLRGVRARGHRARPAGHGPDQRAASIEAFAPVLARLDA